MPQRARKGRINTEPRTESLPGNDRVSLSMPESDSPRQDADLIALCAYQRYEERGRQDGHDMEDWLAAEHELRGESTRSEDGCE